ncbi:restriction endonuclease subunit S [Streptomyces sp. NPDC051130]|uniref:restriction endonuclease subunit S n=1 Tax=Streptomyces sp. NPDC051130 TaxID=3157223 RepID=UPI00342A547A
MRDVVPVRLRDVASRVAVRNSSGNTNVLTISAAHGLVSQEEFFKRRVASADLSQYYLLKEGDFAYNKSYSAGWPVGVMRRLERHTEGVVSPLYICFRPDPHQVNPSFLQHYFDSGILDEEILSIAKEGVRNHGLLNVGVEDFFDLPLKLPPLTEQERITEILDEVDTQIQLSLSEAIKVGVARNSTLRHWLNGPLSDLDNTEVSRVGQLVGTKSGAFEFTTLGNLLESIEAGISPNLEGKPAGEGQWGFLKVSAVGRDGFRQEENKRVDDTSLIDPSIEVRSGDLLVTRANTPDLVGMSCVVETTRPGLMLCDKTLRLNLRDSSGSTEFLSDLLRLPEVRRQIEVSATGTSNSMKNISQESLKGLVIPWGAADIQAEASKLGSEFKKRRAQSLKEIEKLRQLKNALMDDLLYGCVHAAK